MEYHHNTHLERRHAQSGLDTTPIHVGDIVTLQPLGSPRIQGRVIYNAPLDGEITYTTELLGVDSGKHMRFRHEHVLDLTPIRPAAH